MKALTLTEPLTRRPNPCGASAKQGRRRTQAAFTLIELLVVIAIISLLVSILLPSLSRAQELARGAVCQSNMKNFSLPFTMYADDHAEWVCAADDNTGHVVGYWYHKLVAYMSPDMGRRNGAYTCVSDSTARDVVFGAATYTLSYGYPDYFGDVSRPGWETSTVYGRRKLDNIVSPSRCIIMLDEDQPNGAYTHWPSMKFQLGAWGDNVGLPNSWADWRHNDKANAVMADGHAESFRSDSLIAASRWWAGFY